MIAQVWRCPKCGWEYESPVKVKAVECRSRHPRAACEFVEGTPPVDPTPKAAGKVTSKPRVTMARDPQQLFDLLQKR